MASFAHILILQFSESDIRKKNRNITRKTRMNENIAFHYVRVGMFCPRMVTQDRVDDRNSRKLL